MANSLAKFVVKASATVAKKRRNKASFNNSQGLNKYIVVFMFSLTVYIYFKDWLLVDSTTGPRRQLLTTFNPIFLYLQYCDAQPRLFFLQLTGDKMTSKLSKVT